jgi:hypothetical protein
MWKKILSLPQRMKAQKAPKIGHFDALNVNSLFSVIYEIADQSFRH